MATLPDYLRRSEQRLLLKIQILSTSPRGCFARRTTLGRMLGYSHHTINSDLSRLRRRGFITVEKKGVGRAEAARIKMTDLGQRNASRLQAEYKQSHVTHENLGLDKQQQPQKPKRVVVQKEQPSIQEPQETKPSPTEDLLVEKGISPIVAKNIAGNTSTRRVKACIRYVSQTRGEKLNMPGMIVAALSQKWKLPAWAYEGLTTPVKAPVSDAGVGERPQPPTVPDKTQRPSPAPIEAPSGGIPVVATEAKPTAVNPMVRQDLTDSEKEHILRETYLDTDNQQWKAQLLGDVAPVSTAKSAIQKLRAKLREKTAS